MNKRESDIFAHIRERMDKAYERIIGPPGAPGFGPVYMEPPVDIYETEDEVVVLAEIPGIPEEEIDLEIDGTVLALRGERRPLKTRPQCVYSQMEISHGRFQREIPLPTSVSVEGATITYHDGILEISLRKAGAAGTRHLRVVVKDAT